MILKYVLIFVAQGLTVFSPYVFHRFSLKQGETPNLPWIWQFLLVCLVVFRLEKYDESQLGWWNFQKFPNSHGKKKMFQTTEQSYLTMVNSISPSLLVSSCFRSRLEHSLTGWPVIVGLVPTTGEGDDGQNLNSTECWTIMFATQQIRIRGYTVIHFLNDSVEGLYHVFWQHVLFYRSRSTVRADPLRQVRILRVGNSCSGNQLLRAVLVDAISVQICPNRWKGSISHFLEWDSTAFLFFWGIYILSYHQAKRWSIEATKYVA